MVVLTINKGDSPYIATLIMALSEFTVRPTVSFKTPNGDRLHSSKGQTLWGTTAPAIIKPQGDQVAIGWYKPPQKKWLVYDIYDIN